MTNGPPLILEKMIKLVVFDLDGTLVETNTNYLSARDKVQKYFHKLGSDETNFKPILQKIRAEAQKLFDRKLITDREKIEKEAQQIIAEEENNAFARVNLLPYALETLKFLSEKDIEVGIFSRTSRNVIERILTKFGIDVGVVSGREDVSENKPHPEGVIKIIAKKNLKAEEIILVGDHRYDMEAGRAAGVFTIGVLTGVATEADLKASGAKIVLQTLKDFPLVYEKNFHNHRNPRF